MEDRKSFSMVLLEVRILLYTPPNLYNLEEFMIVQPLKDKVLVAENKTSDKTTETGIILDGANSVRDSRAGTPRSRRAESDRAAG